jgi:transcriptional regulator with XRE-family HTH domain
MGDTMSFSERLKKAMAERNISQAELSVLTGIGRSSISQYLSGKNQPKDATIKKLAEALDCSADYLKGLLEDSPQNDKIIFKKVSVAEAAKRLGVCQQAVRVALQQGTAPYGYAWKVKSKWSYHISPKKLDDYIGIDTSDNINNE